jgi:hypothetical protein
MGRFFKIMPKFVQNEFGGLRLIAGHLNGLLIWDKGHVLYHVWQKVEQIVEAMTDQPPSKEKKGVTILTESHWSPNKRYPMPGLAIRSFNGLAKQNPISLTVTRLKTKKGTEIFAGHKPASHTQSALWYLWRYYFQDNGWERLKRCPQCKRWFVDESKNKRKGRCSPHCTWNWWSRARRKQAGHKLLVKNRKEG